MPIRNPFAKRAEPISIPSHSDSPGFEKVDTVGSKTSTAPSYGSGSTEPNEFKLSVVNDSGVYLPPSPPTEKKSFWGARRQPSQASVLSATSDAEIEPFSISRESFDSYRRSFDIGARHQVSEYPLNGRQSLDSARVPRMPRSAMNNGSFERQPPTTEESFEDVGLNDDQQKPVSKEQQPKKKSFLSRFGGDSNNNNSSDEATSSTSRFHIPGRKRGQSTGQGAELGSYADKVLPADKSLAEPIDVQTKEVKEVVV